MALQIFQVDAFTDRLFHGNPAAVMPLESWMDDATLQALAGENNLSETAFMVARDGGFDLRWFTPAVEVDLCGHATLAAAHVLFEHLGFPGDEISFNTRSGSLRVARSTRGLTLDFPLANLAPVPVDMQVCTALGATASEAMATPGARGKLLCVYEFEEDVRALAPDFPALKAATESGVIVTAPGDSCDFVSRYFAPHVGIDEDPVTGSAHCALVPYWSGRLRKTNLRARQVSARGGDLDCELRGDRVFMTGSAVTFMQGSVQGL